MALPISYNVRNVIVRWKVTLLALSGIAMVVGVLIALTAMANGFSKALAATGSDENAIITQRGSASELSSGMSRDNVSMISVDPRVKRDAQGRPMASPEMIVIASLPKRGETTEVNVTVRGVTQMAFAVRQNMKLVEGRQFTPGLYELVVGKKAADRYEGLQVGGSIKLQRKTWNVVGIFTSEGSGFESEIWGDYDALAPVFNRSNGYQSLTLRLADPGSLAQFDAAMDEHHPRNIVLDMRLNGGGDLNTTRDFIQALPARAPGRIFALTSPWTFSAAISSVGYLKQAAPDRVTIVGEGVGDRLNFFSEGDMVTLPNSQLMVLYATERHDYVTGCEGLTDCHGPVIRNPIRVPNLDPDIAAPWTIEAYAAGRDPGMEAVAAALR